MHIDPVPAHMAMRMCARVFHVSEYTTTINPGPICNVLMSIVYGGSALQIPTGVADDDVTCVFKKGS